MSEGKRFDRPSYSIQSAQSPLENVVLLQSSYLEV